MPPKRKNQPRNAYYFFMVNRKQELEAKGFRFPGGLSDVEPTTRQEWNALRPDEKAYYEDLARKEKEDAAKLIFNKKPTATMENYAHVLERNAYEEDLEFTMERWVDDLTIASETTLPENRNFIIIKTIHSCEVLLPRHEFWPLEICVGAFNLAQGIKSYYWTLVDTERAPPGYGSATKETSEETGLPQPGNKVFEEKHRNYAKILTNIKKFVDTFLSDYGPKYILFALEPDIKSADGCLQWLSANAKLTQEERLAMDEFMNKLAFYKLPRLMLRFASLAKRRNDYYNNVIALFNTLEKTAETILTHGCFNYRNDITCDYHNLKEPSIKMNMCCKNVVLRMIYLIIQEIVPAMLIELTDGHDIDAFKKLTTPRAPIPGPPPRIPATGSQPRPPPPQPRPRDFFEPEESSFLSECWGNPDPMPLLKVPADPYETHKSSPVASASGSADRMSRNEDNYGSASAYPPNPDTTKKFRASFDNSERDADDWWRESNPRTPNFMESDFPALDNSGTSLGALWGNSNEGTGGPTAGRGRGLGRGRGAPSASQPWGGPWSTVAGGRGGGGRR